MSRVRARPDHDEIFPVDLPAVSTVACRDELVLGFQFTNQNRIGIVVHGRLTARAVLLARTCTVIPVFLVKAGRT